MQLKTFYPIKAVCVFLFFFLGANLSANEQSANYLLNQGDTLGAVKLLLSRGIEQKKSGNFEKGLLDLGKADQWAKAIGNTEKRFIINFEIAQAMEALGKEEETNNYQIITETQLNKITIEPSDVVTFYNWSANFFESIGNNSEKDRLKNLATEVLKQVAQRKIVEEQAKKQAELEAQKIAEKAVLAEEAQKDSLVDISGFLLYFLIGLLTIIFFTIVFKLKKKRKS